MKKNLLLFTSLLLMCSVYAQELIGVSPRNANKGTTVNLMLTCIGTTFTQSANINVTLMGSSGYIDAQSVTVNNNSKITAAIIIPSNATPGPYDIYIFDSETGLIYGDDEFMINFSATDPRITTVTPDVINEERKLDITITGVNTHFTSGSQLVRFYTTWGTPIEPNHLSFSSATQMVANVTFPKAMWGDEYYNVSVTNNIDGSLNLNNAIVVEASTEMSEITYMNPLSAGKGQMVNMTVKAKGVSFLSAEEFRASLSGFSRELNITGIVPTNDSTLQLTFFIPSNMPAGKYTLMLYTDYDQNIYAYTQFIINGASGQLPEITAVNPPEGQRGQTLNLSITGANTSFNQATNIQVAIYNAATYITANSVDVMSNNLLEANITIPNMAMLGPSTVIVDTDNDGHMELYEGFNVTSASGGVPRALAINPGSASKGQTLDLTITGEYTRFSQASQIDLYFYGQATSLVVNSVTALSNTQLKANVSVPLNAASGFYYVSLNTDNDGWISADGVQFRVLPGAGEPQLVSMSNYRGAPGQTLDLTITGLNTSFSSATTVYQVYFFNQATGLWGVNTEGLSATELKTTLEIPAADYVKGIYNVAVYDNSSNSMLLPQQFSIFSVGVDDKLSQEKNITVYPVPAHDLLYIQSADPLDGIEFINNIGQRYAVRTEDLENGTAGYQIPLNKYNLSPGIYFMKARIGNAEIFKKIIIQ